MLSAGCRAVGAAADCHQPVFLVGHIYIDDPNSSASTPHSGSGNDAADCWPQIINSQVDGRNAGPNLQNNGEIAGHINEARNSTAMELLRSRVTLELGRERHFDDDLQLLAVERYHSHPEQANERRAVQHRLKLLDGNFAHGISTAFPNTSRSVSCLNGTLISESGNVSCTTGLTRPSATRRSSSVMSSGVQPLEPRMLNSND